MMEKFIPEISGPYFGNPICGGMLKNFDKFMECNIQSKMIPY